MYDAGQKVTEVELAISKLSDTVQCITVTEGFSEVLDAEQLDELYCAALKLSAAVLDYIAKAIEYLFYSSVSTFLSLLTLTYSAKSVKKAFGDYDFDTLRSNIEEAIKVYQTSMGTLTATMTLELLRHDKDDKREKILNWVWGGDKWQWQWNRHKFLRENRVANTGRWFLSCKPFREWCSGVNSPLLFCPGLRIPRSTCVTDQYSWSRQVVHDVFSFCS